MAKASIDTGAEINLVRRGLIDPKYFRWSSRPYRLYTANQTAMSGGLKDVECKIVMPGKKASTGENVGVILPVVCYDGDIKVDLI